MSKIIIAIALLFAHVDGANAQNSATSPCTLVPQPFGPGALESEGGTGETFESAVILKNPIPEKNKDTELAIIYERRFLMRCFGGGYRLKKQSLVRRDKRVFDAITVETALGQEKTVYFDLTQFFAAQ